VSKKVIHFCGLSKEEVGQAVEDARLLAQRLCFPVTITLMGIDGETAAISADGPARHLAYIHALAQKMPENGEATTSAEGAGVRGVTIKISHSGVRAFS